MGGCMAGAVGGIAAPFLADIIVLGAPCRQHVSATSANSRAHASKEASMLCVAADLVMHIPIIRVIRIAKIEGIQLLGRQKCWEKAVSALLHGPCAANAHALHTRTHRQ